ncbi:MAG TPA: ATP-binding protein [Rhizomicrobium sp.]|nr:ATP-binding protein [Rhizomicrobium sp.]
MRFNPTGVQAVIIDSDGDFADGLAAKLRAQGYVAMHCAPDNIRELLEKFEPDILLWDIEAAPVTGHLPQIAEARPHLPILPMARRPDHRRLDPGRPATPFIDKRKGVDAAVNVVGDFLNQRENDAFAKTAAKRAEEAKSAEIEFLAKISHELRTPLNAIIGFSELIIHASRPPLDQSQQRAYVEDIYASGRHLLEVINDILDFARAESGKLMLQESDADIGEILTSIDRLLGPRIRDAGLELDLEVPPRLSRLWCDERKLKRMLLNLITNSVKATPSGGRIAVRVTDEDAGIVVSVKDTGVGIPPEDLERVLEPFVQVESALNRRHEGTGLGLALVKAMIEIHGGRIELQSEVGRGTTVRLIFPRERLATPIEDEYGTGENAA